MLDPTASTPLYTQLMEVIERQILTGDRDPGERLPTEGEMAKQFGVSKSTVHKDVAERLEKISPSLQSQVKAVLLQNKQERHIRGGLATKEKYAKMRQGKS